MLSSVTLLFLLITNLNSSQNATHSTNASIVPSNVYATSVSSATDIKIFDHCDYYSNDTAILPSKTIFDSIVIINDSIEIQFKIRSNDFCNTSLCNIFYLHQDNNVGSLSLSINGLQNYFEISVTNNFNFNDIYRIPNANILLPADHKYHNIYLSHSYMLTDPQYNENLFKIDDVEHYYAASVSVLTSSKETYQFYMSDPWNDAINGSVSNLCVNSPIPNVKEIKCGDTLKGELNSFSDVDYYYFDLSIKTDVLFDSCGSSFSLYDIELIELFKADHGDCGMQTQLLPFQLSSGQYILEISSYGNYADHEYGEWMLQVLCDNGSFNIDDDNATYILTETHDAVEWFAAEQSCEGMFGTSLATIITERDLKEAIQVVNNGNDSNRNIFVWMGMYRDMLNGNRWQWIDGTLCDYTSTGDCIDDVHWDSNQPLDDAVSTLDMKTFGAVLFIPPISNGTISAAFRDKISTTWAYLCNAPSSSYRLPSNCVDASCWDNEQHIDNLVLYDDDNINLNYLMNGEPIIAYWNSTLFMIDENYIHYTNMKLYDNQYQWNHSKWNHFTTDLNWGTQRIYAQYKSSIYLYTNSIYFYSDFLMNISLDTFKFYLIDISGISNLQTQCMVAEENSVFLIQETMIVIYKMDTRDFTVMHAFDSDMYDTNIITCSVSGNHKSIYIFSTAFDQNLVTRYDTNSGTITQLNSSSACMTGHYHDTDMHYIRSVAGKNDKIYLHGCYSAGWKTLVFDTETEEFEQDTIDIINPTKDDIPYYRSAQLLSFDDNILLLFYQKSDGFSRYSTITDPISINFKDTEAVSKLWPSDGLEIKYFLNDFNDFINGVHYILFYTNDTRYHSAASVTLNTSKDNCICDDIIYKCYDCHQHLGLNNYLTVMDNDIDQLTFQPLYHNIDNNSLHPLILPKYISLQLQRCNVSITIPTKFTNNNDASIAFYFSLSDNCYSRVGTIFSLEITAPKVRISKEFIITIMHYNTVICNICEIGNKSDCFYCDDDYFVIDPEIRDTNDEKFKIFVKSNNIDFRLTSLSSYTIQYYRSSNATHWNNILWYLLLLLTILLLILLIVLIHCKKHYSHYMEPINNNDNEDTIMTESGDRDIIRNTILEVMETPSDIQLMDINNNSINNMNVITLNKLGDMNENDDDEDDIEYMYNKSAFGITDDDNSDQSLQSLMLQELEDIVNNSFQDLITVQYPETNPNQNQATSPSKSSHTDNNNKENGSKPPNDNSNNNNNFNSNNNSNDDKKDNDDDRKKRRLPNPDKTADSDSDNEDEEKKAPIKSKSAPNPTTSKLQPNAPIFKPWNNNNNKCSQPPNLYTIQEQHYQSNKPHVHSQSYSSLNDASYPIMQCNYIYDAPINVPYHCSAPMILHQNDMVCAYTPEQSHQIKMNESPMYQTKAKKSKQSKKRKSKNARKKQALSTVKTQYDPNDEGRGLGNIEMSKQCVETIKEFVKENQLDINSYIDKVTAMQYNNNQIHLFNNNTMRIHNYGFHHKDTNATLYMISKKVQETKYAKHRGYKYKMIEKLFTAQRMSEYKIDKNKLPDTPRQSVDFIQQISHKDIIAKTLSDFSKMCRIIKETKWHKEDLVPIFRRFSGKRSMTLSLEKTEFVLQLTNYAQNTKSIDLIPIVMFNNHHRHWIEHLWIVKVDDNSISIGISFTYNEKLDKVSVNGIHLDKQYILNQHYLVEPNPEEHKCDCLDGFESDINNFCIYGRPNEDKIRIRQLKEEVANLKQQMQKLKASYESPTFSSQLSATDNEIESHITFNTLSESISITDYTTSHQ